MKIKRENDDITDSDIIDLTHTAPKRQRKEDKASKTAPMTSDIRGTSVPDDLLQVYRHLLPKSREGIAFLFSSTFSDALQAPAERAATLHEVTREQAVEELRRLLAIKVFTVDEDATKISPTPLSKQNPSNNPVYLMLMYRNSGPDVACCNSRHKTLRHGSKRFWSSPPPPTFWCRRPGIRASQEKIGRHESNLQRILLDEPTRTCSSSA
jgi:hypothetical protein